MYLCIIIINNIILVYQRKYKIARHRYRKDKTIKCLINLQKFDYFNYPLIFY